MVSKSKLETTWFTHLVQNIVALTKMVTLLLVMKSKEGHFEEDNANLKYSKGKKLGDTSKNGFLPSSPIFHLNLKRSLKYHCMMIKYTWKH
jgi:hypothetical protein